MSKIYHLKEKRQYLGKDENNLTIWKIDIDDKQYSADKVAVIICDVWDRHWCRGANIRLGVLLDRINSTAAAARDAGVSIIHAPSDTLDYYSGHKARERIQKIPDVVMPESKEMLLPAMPVDAGDEGCDSDECIAERVWSSQHEAVYIDPEKDVISDSGDEVYNWLKYKGITKVLIMGVHTNMCIINRSFGLKHMTELGFDVSLIRDLTDAMYNPERSPYVSHEEGTQLVIGYIEKFICSSILSEDLI